MLYDLQAQKVKDHLKDLGYVPHFFYGDGFKGLPAFAPFDKIIVTCGAPFVPDLLVDQLKPGGIMVIPVDVADGIQEMMLIKKNIDKSLETKKLGQFKFVPMLGDKE